METWSMDNIWSKIGGRKMVAFVVTLIAVMWLAYQGLLTQETLWAALGLYGTFSGSNVGEHFAGALAKRQGPVAGNAAVGDVVAVDMSVEDIAAVVGAALMSRLAPDPEPKQSPPEMRVGSSEDAGENEADDTEEEEESGS